MIEALILLSAVAASTAQQHFDRAAALIQSANWRSAATEYHAGLEKAPAHADAHNNLGAVYFELNEPARAVGAFRKAVALKPANEDFRFNLALALFRAGDGTEAIQHLVRVTGARGRYLAGVCHILLGHWADAAPELEAAQMLGKSDPETWYLLIKSYRRSGRGQDGMRAFASLASLQPSSEFVHRLLAEAFEASGDEAGAEREFREALKTTPDSPDLHFGLAYLLWRRKQWDEARSLFVKEQKLDSASARASFYLGSILLHEDRAGDAFAHYERARELAPEWGDVYVGLGQSALRLNRASEAAAYLRKAVTLLPDRPEAHYQLARALQLTGNAAESGKHLAVVKRLRALEREREQALLAQSQPEIGSR